MGYKSLLALFAKHNQEFSRKVGFNTLPVIRSGLY